MTDMCIKCKYCLHKGDYKEDPTGLCVYNPPAFIPESDYGRWPIVYLNSYCSKFELKGADA